MPVWLERIVLRNAGVEYLPALVCVGLAVAVWWWQWSRRAKRPAEGGERGTSLRVGWGPGAAILSLVVVGVAAFAVMTGMGAQAWAVVQREPWLAAWWVVGVGVAVALWGVAVHAWRGEGRLGRRCRCGYDMTAVGGMRCPECGREAKSERQLRPLNVRRWALWVAGLIFAGGLVLPTVIGVSQRGPAAALPSRTLLWWMTKTSTPPESVLVEVQHRYWQDAIWWREQIAANSRELTERMMESKSGRVNQYALLLVEGGAAETEEIAAQGIVSTDPIRRRNAAALFAAAGGWQRQIPLSVIEELLADPDLAMQANGRALIGHVVPSILQRLNGADGKPAESDPKRVRTLVRMLCDVQPNLASPNLEQLTGACASADPEAAACAAILRARWAMMTSQPDPAFLRAAVVGSITLKKLKAPPVVLGLNLPGWVGSPQGREKLVPLLADPDPVVRLELISELDTAIAPWSYYFKTSTDPAWAPLREALEARLAVEPDAEIARLLRSAVTTMNGKAPAQP